MRWSKALVYFDDVVIFSCTLEAHANSLDKLLASAARVGLKFSPDKCHFALPSLSLLGRTVSTSGVSVLHDRAHAIQSIASPANLQQLYHVLGLFNYYRQFIPGYAAKAAPLTGLIKGHCYLKFGEKWHLTDAEGHRTSPSQVHLPWTAAHNDALASLKTALSSPPTLAYPDYDRPFILYVDASTQAFAAALHQRLPPPSTNPAACHLSFSTDGLAERQRRDATLGAIIRSIDRDQPRLGYELQDGLLLYVGPQRTRRQLCIPIHDFGSLFADHNDGHFGFAKTYGRLSSFHHPRPAADLGAYIDNCPVCLRTKLRRRTGQLSLDRTLQASRPFHTISIDLVLGLPTSGGFDAILAIVDLCSRFTFDLLHLLPFRYRSCAQPINVTFPSRLPIASSPSTAHLGRRRTLGRRKLCRCDR